jgi:hypothetical protein
MQKKKLWNVNVKIANNVVVNLCKWITISDIRKTIWVVLYIFINRKLWMYNINNKNILTKFIPSNAFNFFKGY